VFERFPNLKMCSVHGGGFIPYQMGRLDRGAALRPDLFPGLTKPPSEYAKQIYIDTVLHSVEAARYAIDAFGVDKVLLGTDYPFPMGELEPVDFVKSIPGLTDADVAAILGGTAEQLLG
jgi:aminocarboxymuconate-semialdehyde decarboxylase